MNDDVKDRMTKYLDAMEKAAGKVGDFAEVEVPATIREWLLWMTVEHCFFALIFLMCAIVAYRTGKKIVEFADKEDPSNDSPGPFLARTFRLLLTLGLMIGFVVQSMWAVKCVVAPRVVVVEQVAELVKSKK